MPKPFLDWMEDLIKKAESKTTATATTVIKEKIQVGVSKAMIDAVDKYNYPVVSISADLQGSTGVANFRKQYSQLSFDVGVAEANMVSMGVGLSKQGYIPVVDTFAQFGVTKGALPLIMSGLSQGPVIGVFSHTGFQDAADGASHQALSYVSMLCSVPHVQCFCLSSSEEAYALVGQAIEQFAKLRQQGKTPDSYIFFLGREDFPQTYNKDLKYQLGKAQIIKEEPGHSQSVTIAVAGSLVHHALKAQETLAKKNIGSVVIHNSLVNRPDVDTFKTSLQKTNGCLITLEDHRVDGGMGSLLCHALLRANVDVKKLVSLGVDNHFGRSAYKADQLYRQYGIDDLAVVEAALSLF